MSPAEMTAAVQRMSRLDLVLVDTSGRSQRDSARVAQLQAFLDAGRGATIEGPQGPASPNFEILLVLSCTAHHAQLAEVVERFTALGADRVVFSKLDEAVGAGVILNVASRLKLQLSYLTTGQDVPDDLEVGHRRRIAELVLNVKTPMAETSARTSGCASLSVDQVA